MITRTISILLLFFLHSTLVAQTNENSLIWEISGNGLNSPSYMFGILKFIPAEDYYFPKAVEDKFKSCKVLATETQLDHHARHELNKAAHLEQHKGIDDFLTDEEYQNLLNIFETKLSISEFKFNVVYKKFKPIMLSTTMTRLTLGENIKYYELELINMANALGMSMHSLESVENEINALNKIKLEDQVASLKHTIENFDQQVEDYKKLVEYYKNGDLHNTLEYTMHPIESHSDYEKHFINGRNQNWISQMVNLMKDNSTFFAIGASHLSENYGLINMLVEKGYTVKAVKN